jgi:hypothetical protein
MPRPIKLPARRGLQAVLDGPWQHGWHEKGLAVMASAAK